jgi:hypothetical protein
MHSAGVKSVHDSDFSNELGGIHICSSQVSLLFDTTSDDTTKPGKRTCKQGGHIIFCMHHFHLLYILCISLFQSTLIVTYSLFLLLVNAEQLTRPSLAKMKEQPGIDHSYERSFCLCLVVLHGTTRKAWHPNPLDSLGIGSNFPSVDTGRRNIEVGKHLFFFAFQKDTKTTRRKRCSSRHDPKLGPPVLRRRFVGESPFPQLGQ